MSILNITRGYTLIVNDNTNLVLELGKVKWPTLEEITETHHPGGSDIELDVSGLGTKAPTMQFELKTNSPTIMGLYGGPPGKRHNFTGKKLVISEEDGSEHEHAVDLLGRLGKVESKDLEGGKSDGYDHEIKSIWTYTEYWDSRIMHRFSFKLGGWDIWNFEPINIGRRRVLFS